MAKLTTHVLDTANGKPASNVSIRLYSVAAEKTLLATTQTNADGRSDAPLLEGAALKAGAYELEFDIAAYFAAQGNALSDPPFLDTVVLRFSLAAHQHYHVPLLVSPWSYSTYRGS